MDDLSGIRVLVVDDHAHWRRMVIEHLLMGRVQIAGTASDGFEAVQKARVLRPDVIVMDLAMPRLSGLAATREVRTFVPEARVVIVSCEGDPAVAAETFTAGALGYVLKSRVGVELLPAIAAIVRGDRFVGKGVTTDIGDDPRLPS